MFTVFCVVHGKDLAEPRESLNFINIDVTGMLTTSTYSPEASPKYLYRVAWSDQLSRASLDSSSNGCDDATGNY